MDKIREFFSGKKAYLLCILIIMLFWKVDYVSLAEAAFCQALIDCTGSNNKVGGNDWNNARVVAIYDPWRITIESPVEGDTFMLGESDLAFTVTAMDCRVEDATSAIITLQECDQDGNSCTTIESVTCAITKTSDNGIDDSAIASDSVIRALVGVVTGTVDHVNITMHTNLDQ